MTVTPVSSPAPIDVRHLDPVRGRASPCHRYRPVRRSDHAKRPRMPTGDSRAVCLHAGSLHGPRRGRRPAPGCCGSSRHNRSRDAGVQPARMRPFDRNPSESPDVRLRRCARSCRAHDSRRHVRDRLLSIARGRRRQTPVPFRDRSRRPVGVGDRSSPHARRPS